MENLRIVEFNSNKNHGQMNTAFYPKEMPKDEKIRLMHDNKQSIVGEMGLSYKNIFIPIQKNSKNPDKYEDGLCYTLTSDDVKNYDDLYDYDVYADIVKLTPETRNIVLAYPVADCAVVKAVNMKTNEIVLSHCGGEYIDRYLPMQTIDALGGNEKDIRVYVSPFAYNLFYSDAANLSWANNDKVWKEFKEYSEKDGITAVNVNVYDALKKQLLDRKIKLENMYFSPYDTSKSNMFYSNSRGYQDESFKGRFMAGIGLIDNDKEIEENESIRIVK